MKTEKTVKRLLVSRLPRSDQRRLVIVTGARQTGKTTLLRAIYPSLRYVSLDVHENRDWLRNLSALRWNEDVGEAFIDEAQKEPQVFEKVKYAFDAHELRFTALSGSAQILLLHQVRESLAGRAFVYELWPLMFSELAGVRLNRNPEPPLFARLCDGEEGLDRILAASPPQLSPQEQAGLTSVQEHLLRWGGMPELLRLEDADRREWLRSYEHTYLERDLGDLARLADLMPFRKFQSIAALRSAQLLAYADLARDAGVSAETSRRYLEYLRLSYQAFFLPPYHTNLTSQLTKAQKVYWTDTGLMRQVSAQPEGVTGPIFETFVVSELHKWVQTSGVAVKLFHYRTRSGLEADVLVETPRGLLGIEIKARAQADRSDAGPLRRIAESAGSRWLGGMIVHSGTALQRLCDPCIWSMPASRLLS
ncbi:MAG: ATP-binding protein [bacterium]